MTENNSVESVVTEATTVEPVQTDTTAPSQDPVETELKKVQEKGEGKTELEKLRYKKAQIEKRERELLGDQGVDVEPSTDDNAPVTVGMLKKIEREKAQETALSLAQDEVTDERERELVIHHLNNTIKPSGNPREDFRAARLLVNAVKHGQLAEEVARKGVSSQSTIGGAPGKSEAIFTPTAEELTFMRPPFNMTKEQVIMARKKEEDSRK